MKTQHTPGPWILNVDQDDDFTMRTILSSEKKVNHHKEVAIVTTGSYPDEIEHANALLIAAAPELLQELEIAVKHIKNIQEKYKPEIPFAIGGYEAIIKKAKGL